VFWTVRIPSSAVEVNLGAGTARMHITDQHIPDFGSIPNAIGGGSSDPGIVSYDIRWHGVKRRRQVHNADFHVAGLFVDTDASIQWTGHNLATGFTFTSSAAGQHAISAQLGHERNGVFFS
jgi:hypothetical protein